MNDAIHRAQELLKHIFIKADNVFMNRYPRHGSQHPKYPTQCQGKAHVMSTPFFSYAGPWLARGPRNVAMARHVIACLLVLMTKTPAQSKMLLQLLPGLVWV
jgi:hypothetical protein